MRYVWREPNLNEGKIRKVGLDSGDIRRECVFVRAKCEFCTVCGVPLSERARELKPT